MKSQKDAKHYFKIAIASHTIMEINYGMDTLKAEQTPQIEATFQNVVSETELYYNHKTINGYNLHQHEIMVSTSSRLCDEP